MPLTVELNARIRSINTLLIAVSVRQIRLVCSAVLSVLRKLKDRSTQACESTYSPQRPFLSCSI